MSKFGSRISFVLLSSVFAQTLSQAYWLPMNGKMTSYSWGEKVFVVSTLNSIQVFETRSSRLIASEILSGGTVVSCTSDGVRLAWISQDSAGNQSFCLKKLDSTELDFVVNNITIEKGDQVAILNSEPGLIGTNWKKYSPISQSFEEFSPTDSAGSKIEGQPVKLANDLITTISPYKFRTSSGAKKMMSKISAYRAEGNRLKFLASYVSDGPVYQSLLIKKQNRQSVVTEADFQIKQPNLSLRAEGFTVWETDERVDLPVRLTNWSPNRLPRKSSVAESMLWENQNGLIKLESSQSQQVFLPWNGASDKVLGMVPKSDGTWIFSQSGVSLLQPDRTSSDFGFAGYIAQNKGDDNTDKWTEKQSKLVSELQTWFGTKYVYGGNDRKGIDCSGLVQQAYKTLGIELPRTSATMRTTKMGEVVKDFLKCGDVLTYPGHVAVYIGGGKTIETVKGGVSYGSIWSRRDVVVRRFLGP